MSSSSEYWEMRYQAAHKSGPGSYGALAEYKAEVLNDFVRDHKVQSVTELGCGDGNQLSLARYPAYVGLDIAPTAVRLCKERFKDDPTRQFHVYRPDVHDSSAYLSDLSVSLEVIFHLVEDDIYEKYMRHLFAMARRYVIIFSSDATDGCRFPEAEIVKHRPVVGWVARHEPDWRLTRKLDNPYPFNPEAEVHSVSDFFIFERNVR